MRFTGIFNSNVSRNKQMQTMIKHVPFDKSMYNPPVINLNNNNRTQTQIKNIMSSIQIRQTYTPTPTPTPVLENSDNKDQNKHHFIIVNKSSELLISNPFYYTYTTDGGCPEYRSIKTYHELSMQYNIFNKRYTNFSLKSFYEYYDDFNYEFYKNKYYNNDTNIDEISICKEYHEKGIYEKRLINNKIKIIVYTRPLDTDCGGIVALHNLAKCINDLHSDIIYAKLFIYNGLTYTNNFCNNFANINEINDNTIVIYPETISGNPLNCKKVIRWILLALGKEMPKTYYTNWGINDLVYYFNSEPIFSNNPTKIDILYKMLPLLYLPKCNNLNMQRNNKCCHAIRKAEVIAYHNNMKIPNGSFEITRQHDQETCIGFFNTYSQFIAYDPLTFLTIIAALCGCLSIVYPIKGVNKQQWLSTTAVAPYLMSKGLDNIYGIAYGFEDINYAKSTLHLVKDQWNDIINYYKEKYVRTFTEDMVNYVNNLNKVSNLFY